MTGLLRVLFTPSCWIQGGRYSSEWNQLLISLMSKHKFEGRKEHIATLGPTDIWVSNHPYCSFRPYKYNNGVLCGPVPKRITALRAMDKLDQDTWFDPTTETTL